MPLFGRVLETGLGGFRAMGFQGAVDRFSLADVFQNLALKQLTGLLRVYMQDGPERRLHFEAGHVRALDSGRQKPLRLGEMLVGRGVLNQEQVEGALARHKECGRSLGVCMVEMDLIDADVLDEFLARQIEEGILELFAWQNAHYEFTEGPPPDDFLGDRLARSAPFLSASQLVMEAGRRVDEWDRLRTAIPSFREVFVIDEGSREKGLPDDFDASSTEFRLFPWIDGQRDVEDLIEESFLFRFEILQALVSLKETGVIRSANPAELAAAAEALKRNNKMRRLSKILERLLALGYRRGETRAALAETLVETGDAEKAAGHLGILAEEELAEGKTDEAIAHLQRGSQLAPQHLPLLERLGALYIQRNMKVEALQQYDVLARAYRERRQWAEAREACEQILKLEPDDSAARRALIEICLEMGDRASAVRECEVLGETMHRQGLPDDAARYLQRALEIEPQREDIQRKLSALNSRPKRIVRSFRPVVAVMALIVLVALGVPAGREYIMNSATKDALERAGQLEREAEALEQKRDFESAAQKYDAAAQLLRDSRAAKTWTLLGQNRKLDAAAGRLGSRSAQARKEAASDRP